MLAEAQKMRITGKIKSCKKEKGLSSPKTIVLKTTSTSYSKLIHNMLYVLRIPSKDFLFGFTLENAKGT